MAFRKPLRRRVRLNLEALDSRVTPAAFITSSAIPSLALNALPTAFLNTSPFNSLNAANFATPVINSTPALTTPLVTTPSVATPVFTTPTVANSNFIAPSLTTGLTSNSFTTLGGVGFTGSQPLAQFINPAQLSGTTGAFVAPLGGVFGQTSLQNLNSTLGATATSLFTPPNSTATSSNLAALSGATFSTLASPTTFNVPALTTNLVQPTATVVQPNGSLLQTNSGFNTGLTTQFLTAFGGGLSGLANPALTSSLVNPALTGMTAFTPTLSTGLFNPGFGNLIPSIGTTITNGLPTYLNFGGTPLAITTAVPAFSTATTALFGAPATTTTAAIAPLSNWAGIQFSQPVMSWNRATPVSFASRFAPTTLTNSFTPTTLASTLTPTTLANSFQSAFVPTSFNQTRVASQAIPTRSTNLSSPILVTTPVGTTPTPAPGPANLDANLRRLAALASSGDVTSPTYTTLRQFFVTQGNSVLLDIKPSGSPAALTASLASLGMSVQSIDPATNIIEGYAPIANVNQIASLPGITAINPVVKPLLGRAR